MKQTTHLLLLFFFITFSYCQTEQEVYEETVAYQNNLNQKYTHPETTILLAEDFKSFKGLEFYPIDLKFRVEAVFIRTPDELPFLMSTTTTRLPEYVKYGELHFQINAVELVLDVFQDTDPGEGYENYLFLPFTDLTSGDGSYGGGRYLDLLIPNGDYIIIDFNLSYNPYCAYNPHYSCPIPPPQNDLDVRVEAGVKAYNKQ